MLVKAVPEIKDPEARRFGSLVMLRLQLTFDLGWYL
jgi:hypothetical protein